MYRELTVDEYLGYCARLNRIARNRRQAAINTARERCGLEDVGRRLIGNLSKGYQQRVGIAQAIIHTPAVVILDEPTVGLDPIQIREIRTLIRELGQDHGIILSTHILPEVQATCNRVQIINQGRLVFSDSLHNLEQRMDATSLIARFRAPPGAAELQQIAGIGRVEALDGGRLVEKSVAANWGLEELIPQRMTLEQIFIDLTTADIHHAASGEAA